MQIVVDDLSGPEIAAFLTDHVRQMHETTPLEFAFALDLDALRRPDITFWSATDDGGAIVGCAALKRLGREHAELKSMRTAPARTRSGVASRILEHLIAEARERGYRRMSLETGTAAFFLPARRLYEKFGFEYCSAFGDYEPSPHNTFMTRLL
jgi:putative acetyltransferase